MIANNIPFLKMKLVYPVLKLFRPFFLGLLMLLPSIGWAQSAFTIDPDPATGCGFLQVRFTDTSTGTGTLTGLSWNFGDGGTLILGTVGGVTGDPLRQTVNRLYSQPGNYTVTLIAYFDGTAQPQATATVTVNPLPDPVIEFTPTSENNCTPYEVQFRGDQSTGSSAISEYFWVFGDGSVSTAPNPTHVYERPGTYNVTLSITDANGCENTISLETPITVGEPVNLNPNAAQTAFERISCQVPLTVDFTSDPGEGNFEFLWDFGDGTTSELQNPSHTYTEFGTYSIRLSATNLETGCTSDTLLADFVQLAPFEPAFEVVQQEPGCPPVAIDFLNTSNLISPSQRITWDFGDGTTITGSIDSLTEVSHIYQQEGSYTVSIFVEDTGPGGCSGGDTLENAVVIEPPVVADFTADQTGFCQLQPDNTFAVAFTDNSTGAPISWEWDFGDGNTSTDQNPTHTYTGFGTYSVTLTVTNASGCSDTQTFDGYIQAFEPIAAFTAYAEGGCFPDFSTTLIDSSLTASPVVSWNWQVFDRSGALVTELNGEDPTVALSDTGSYTVVLNIETEAGCSATDTVENFLNVGVRPSDLGFTPSDFEICNGTTVDFTNNSTMPDNPYETIWIWDYFGDGNVLDTAFNGSYTYDNSDPNPITVRLYSFNNGCVDTVEVEPAVLIAAPRADIDVFTDPCSSDSIYLNDASIGAQRFEWEITIGGDTFTETEVRNPAIFVPPGESWSATLTVFNDSAREGAGCEHSTTVGGDQPADGVADFSNVVRVNRGSDLCFPVTFDFNGNVTVPGQTITDHYWEFGNSTTDTTQIASATYDLPGLYSVRLVVTTDLGCTFDTTFTDWIEIVGPQINFEVCDAGTCKEREVTFRDVTTSIGQIVRRTWDLGDGTVFTFTDPDSTQFTYVYDSVNTPQDEHFMVVLEVEDEFGCIGRDSVKVRPTKPIPEFLIESEPECGGEIVSFLAADSLSQGLKPFGAQWAFSDGQTAGGMDPILSFEGSLEGTEYEATLYIFDLNSCVDSLTLPFTVFRDVIDPGFIISDTSALCPPFEVTFTDTSRILSGYQNFNNSIVDWVWDFGDGNTIEGVQNPTYRYLEPGTFDVTLTVTDSLGCDTTYVMEDLVSIGGPIGDFTVSDTIGYAPLTVDILGIPDNPEDTLSYIWDLGQGDFIEGQDTSFTYNQPGVYLLGLILDDGNCQYAIPDKQRIEVLPCPNLNLPPVSHCVSDDTLFLSVYDSTHEVRLGQVNYQWLDEAGAVIDTSSTLALAPPQGIEAPVTESYTIILWIDNIDPDNPGLEACRDTLTVPVTFEPGPTAALDYAFDCARLTAGDFTIDFDASGSDGFGQDLTFLWDFDNDSIFGEAPDEQPGTPSGEEISFAFDSAGVYPIQLIAQRGGNGCNDTLRREVYVPGANFTFNVTDICQGSEVVFADSSIYDPEMAVSYAWDINNGEVTGSDSTIAYTPTVAGSIPVELTITVAGCPLTITRNVEVAPVPEQLDLEVVNPCPGSPTLFSYPVQLSVPDSVVRWEWDFESDGTVDLTTDVSETEFLYTQTGEQVTASVVAFTNSGCTIAQSATFTLGAGVVPNFSAFSACEGSPVVLRDQSSIPGEPEGVNITQWEFDFDQDGTFDSVYTTAQDFTHLFPVAGVYPVTMRVTTSEGCVADTVRNVNVAPSPEADFEFSTVLCENAPVSFIDRSNSFGQPLIAYDWDFDGDGLVDASGNAVTHRFEGPGEYEVTYRVTNISNCSDEITRTVTVLEQPDISLPEDLTVCSGETVELQASTLSDITNWQWNTGQVTQGITVTVNETAEYIVTGFDANGCSASDTVTVSVLDFPSLPADTVACEGVPITLVGELDIPGATVTYNWVTTGETTPNITVDQSGVYQLVATVSGIGGELPECTITQEVTVTFAPGPLPIPEDSLSFCFNVPEDQLPYELTVPGVVFTASWVNLGTGEVTQGATLPLSEVGTYAYRASSQQGCVVEDTIRIIESCEPLLFPPTAFTPNGDGRNDQFEILGQNISRFEITIFNRWGEVVFASDDLGRSWDGKHRGKDSPTGLYPFVITYESTFTPGREYTRRGTVTIIR